LRVHSEGSERVHLEVSEGGHPAALGHCRLRLLRPHLCVRERVRKRVSQRGGERAGERESVCEREGERERVRKRGGERARERE